MRRFIILLIRADISSSTVKFTPDSLPIGHSVSRVTRVAGGGPKMSARYEFQRDRKRTYRCKSSRLSAV